ncbi:MAG: tetratricopeptide repeat protein [Proteobacteria bacterium]|nr:tetratricopeptide repeat protein [Pseudomonadota bacterium]
MTRFLSLVLALAVLALPVSARADQTSPDLDGLFERLKTTSGVAETTAVEAAIWTIWLHRGTAEIDAAMALGIAAMNEGAYRRSLSTFDRMVRAAPDFAEAWNKRATVHYLMGDFDASVADIRRTLALEPRHFGALSGMGLIYDAIGNQTAAAKVWEKALEIHPNMPGMKARIQELRAKAKGRAL